MKDPQIIEDITPENAIAASYKVPTFKVTENGIEDGDGFIINFCKGDKSNPEVFRQEGFFSETLIKIVKTYLETVNAGTTFCRENSIAITKLDEALMWLDKRSADRKRREVQGTYNS
jgi:hypothetical protein